ncbi:hypothetical protein G5I_08102 [Acromyrmex echinatior]|uniref:Uncharacterized protein n=1 Tax=Acromyrmex echinatior TaxID=103372 RepID=F4WQI3_ACREC|nr:hypothetical protein G5I_08102 [Acromyrmex echinatior]
MEPALHEMGISGYLEEVRTGETRADMNGHVKTNVLSALQGKVIPVNSEHVRQLEDLLIISAVVLSFLLFFHDETYSTCLLKVLPRGIEIGMSVPPARTCSSKQQVTQQGAGYPMHTECCYQPSGKGIYYVI